MIQVYDKKHPIRKIPLFKFLQTRARREIDEVWRKCNGKLGMAEVQKFSYLERCIKETLRKFPSVHWISRKITEELQLS